ncbi:3-methylitaconate isomerase [Vibrio sp. qd031]|uniref:2-methylaconitate cis-trans isomerase PrpF n=1 Tax=Vibrio sp. qd031 TaxID=1603038 RepID=UPI000A114F59|nr:2-methylaconitate cis-trans isomerase PrpF [Vibrio sp. qd031]ORT51029.1 3-methylitaconate isomerase [Vibrio sp. qd031]
MSKQISIPATYMRGGTSKGVLFRLDDLPIEAQVPGPIRDALLMRVIGSPDPYSKQIDGLGGATSSTSKVAIVSKSDRDDHQVDYLFGQVSIDGGSVKGGFIDWSGNCGNLTAAVGAFAVHSGLIEQDVLPNNGKALIKIWQANIEKTLQVHLPICEGEVQELGDFMLDGVAFPAAEIAVDFLEPTSGVLFPTGNVMDDLELPDVGVLSATMINAGIPTVFVTAEEIGLTGVELQSDINSDTARLEQLESIRAHAALAMGLITKLDEAKIRQHTPKVAFVSKAKDYVTSSGTQVHAADIDLNVRAMSMGQLHHAMMGTAAVAIASAAAIEGTLVNRLCSGEGNRSQSITFGHPSGCLKVGAIACNPDAKQGVEHWKVKQATMSRSARILMQGVVKVPPRVLLAESGDNQENSGASDV